MLGQKDVSGITAIKHSLRDIDSGSYKVRFVINILHSIDWAAVNSHPQLDPRTILQSFANLQSTAQRLFRTAEEKERHAVSSRHANEFAGRCRRPETFGASDDLIEFLQQFNLLIVR
jgi:hypothetical protein